MNMNYLVRIKIESLVSKFLHEETNMRLLRDSFDFVTITNSLLCFKLVQGIEVLKTS